MLFYTKVIIEAQNTKCVFLYLLLEKFSYAIYHILNACKTEQEI